MKGVERWFERGNESKIKIWLEIVVKKIVKRGMEGDIER